MIPETHLIRLVLQAAAGLQERIDIFGDDYATPDGTCIRDDIHVADLAAAHVAALAHCEPGRFRPVNLGAGTGFSVREVIEVARRTTNRDIPVHVTERRPGDPPALVADASRASELLQWRPRCSDRETIIDTAWSWMRQGRARVMP